MYGLFLLLILLGQPVEQNPAVPKVVLPVVPVAQPAEPIPSNPDVPVVLQVGRLYVLECEVPFFVEPCPAGLVSVKDLSGPRDFYGVFAGGSGREEDRTYQGKYLKVIKAVDGKQGPVTLVTFPQGIMSQDQIQRVMLTIAPRGPPEPDVPVTPDKPDKPDDPKPSSLKSELQQVTDKYTSLPAVDRPKLAAVFRETAVKIEAGSIATMQDLTQVTADAMVEKIGLNALLPWIKWRDEITDVLKTKNLNTPKDNVAAWKLIADVLEGK